MATNRVWNVKYVVGNPTMFSKVTTNANGPLRRADALKGAKRVAENGGGWRVWVEHATTGERIFESIAEINHKTASAT